MKEIYCERNIVEVLTWEREHFGPHPSCDCLKKPRNWDESSWLMKGKDVWIIFKENFICRNEWFAISFLWKEFWRTQNQFSNSFLSEVWPNCDYFAVSIMNIGIWNGNRSIFMSYLPSSSLLKAKVLKCSVKALGIYFSMKCHQWIPLGPSPWMEISYLDPFTDFWGGKEGWIQCWFSFGQLKNNSIWNKMHEDPHLMLKLARNISFHRIWVAFLNFERRTWTYFHMLKF